MEKSSAGHDDKNMLLFWTVVPDAFLKRDIIRDFERTAESLVCRWATLERVLQKYLAAEKLYHSKLVSDETAEDASPGVMRLYCTRNNKKDSYGVVRDGPPLIYFDAVAIMRNCPKFSGTNNKKERMQPSKSNLLHVNSAPEVKKDAYVTSETNVGDLAE